MENSELQAFTKTLIVVAEIFKEDLSQSKERVLLYFEILRGYQLKDISDALKDYIKTGDFFPKPAQIIRLIQSRSKFTKALPPPEINEEGRKRIDAILKELAQTLKEKRLKQ